VIFYILIKKLHKIFTKTKLVIFEYFSLWIKGLKKSTTRETSSAERLLIVLIKEPLWTSSSMSDKNIVMFFFWIHSNNALKLHKNLPFILELFQVVIKETKLFILEPFKLKVIRGLIFINSSIEIFIVVSKLFLLILFQPKGDFVLDLKLLLWLCILSFGFSWLEDDFTSFKTECKTLRAWGGIKSNDTSFKFLLISHFIWVWFEDFEIIIKRSSNVPWSLWDKFDIGNNLFIITSFEQRLSCSNIPNRDFISTTNNEVKFWWIKIHRLNLFFVYEFKLSLFMDSEIEQFHNTVIRACKDVIIFKSFDWFDVISVCIVIRMDYLTCSDIVVSDDKVVTSWIQVVVLILQGVDFLLVVVELSQVEFFFYIHDLDSTWFISCCEYITVFSYT